MKENEKKLLPKQYKRRFEVKEVNPDDLGAILDVGLASLKGQRAKYPETQDGLQLFQDTTIEYFEYIQRCNDEGREHNLIPDVEGLCSYLGITRQTLLTYEKQRSEEWRDFIQKAKTLITSCKKQLIFRQKIPAVVGIFDLCNNSNYFNSSEFRIIAEPNNAETKQRLAIDEELRQNGLRWNEDTRSFEPM